MFAMEKEIKKVKRHCMYCGKPLINHITFFVARDVYNPEDKPSLFVEMEHDSFASCIHRINGSDRDKIIFDSILSYWNSQNADNDEMVEEAIHEMKVFEGFGNEGKIDEKIQKMRDEHDKLFPS